MRRLKEMAFLAGAIGAAGAAEAAPHQELTPPPAHVQKTTSDLAEPTPEAAAAAKFFGPKGPDSKDGKESIEEFAERIKSNKLALKMFGDIVREEWEIRQLLDFDRGPKAETPPQEGQSKADRNALAGEASLNFRVSLMGLINKELGGEDLGPQTLYLRELLENPSKYGLPTGAVDGVE